MATTSYDGPASIKERDAYHPQYAMKTKNPLQAPRPTRPMNHFAIDKKGVCPVVFKPDGSFQALRQQGKLSDPRTFEGEEARDVMREKKYFMPGYTGFVRASQHISGRTYGEMTRRAYDTEFAEHLRTSPIPSGPQANRKIPQQELQDTFVSNNLSFRENHVPGYTGHVPGARATYAKTFGETTLQQMKTFKDTYPRQNQSFSKPNFAATVKPRQLMPIDSAPLPGTTYRIDAPRKMIPPHIEYLRFYSM